MTRLLSLLPVMVALILTGCGSSRTVSSVQHDRRTLQWGVVGVSDVPTLDPALASDPVSINVASLVYGGLVRLDSNLRVQPDGAQSWKISHGGRVYTFTLRPDLRFPNGRRVVASDFAAAIERSLGALGASGTGPYYLGAIAHGGVTVHGPRTVRITLSQPAAHFLAELAFPASFVPDPSTVARYGTTWTDHAAGFGPYRVLSWEHSRSLTLVPNPHYYGGAPAFHTITLHFYGRKGAIAAYNRGALDLVSGFLPGAVMHGVQTGVEHVPALALDYLAFNTDQLPFHRLRARYAFAAAISPGLIKEAAGASVAPVSGFLPSAFHLGAPLWRPAASPHAYLTAARYGGKTHLPPLVLVLPRDPTVHAIARAMRTQWQKTLGAQVIVTQLDTSAYDQVLAQHSYNLAIVRWGGDYPDPQDFLGTQLSDSPDNVTGWARRAMNEDIMLADSYDPRDPRRAHLFQQAASLAAEKVPILPLDQPLLTALVRPELRGVTLTPLGTIEGSWTAATLQG